MSSNGPRVLAYSHDGYGLGHLRRNLRIVSGLKKRRPDISAALITGAKGAERIVAGFDVRCFALPAVQKVANGCYVPEDSFDGADVIAVRTGLIEEAFRHHRPDLVLVDRYPLGMKEELLPALEWLRHDGGDVAVVLGLRDIIDESTTVREEWKRAGHSEAVRRYYDSVLIYGDRTLFDPIDEYGIDRDIAELTHFTGYLTDDLVGLGASELRHRLFPNRGRLVLCTLGGGRDAYPIAKTFLQAAAQLQPDGWSALLVTGPYMSGPDVDRLREMDPGPDINIVEMVTDLPSHLAAADAVVCMGGYNTMCEVLAMAAPAVVVPRVTPRQEQLMRASRFAARGLVRMVDPATFGPEVLADELRRATQEGSRAHEALETISHKGIYEAAHRLDDLIPVRIGTA
jgi:predicted glycosyltransferase